MLMQTSYFRVGRMSTMRRRSHHQVEAPHGLKNNTQPRGPKRSQAIKEPGITEEMISGFVKKMKTWRPFSDPCLVETNFITGHSLMKRIHSGGAPVITLTMGGLGIGDITIRKSINMTLSLRIWSQMKGWPSGCMIRAL